MGWFDDQVPDKPLIVQPSQDDMDEINGYEVGKWVKHGKVYKNFTCLHCQFQTLYLERMKKHQATGRHPWPFPTKDADNFESVEAGGDGEQYW